MCVYFAKKAHLQETIKVLCEQTREFEQENYNIFWIMFNIISFREYCSLFSCLEYEQ